MCSVPTSEDPTETGHLTLPPPLELCWIIMGCLLFIEPRAFLQIMFVVMFSVNASHENVKIYQKIANR